MVSLRVGAKIAPAPCDVDCLLHAAGHGVMLIEARPGDGLAPSPKRLRCVLACSESLPFPRQGSEYPSSFYART